MDGFSGDRIPLVQDEIITEPGPDPELNFETGIETGAQETLDEVAERLIDEGFDEDEVEELLYDPAPRRRHRIKHRRSRRSGRKHPAMVYDPAPRRRGRSAYPKSRSYSRRAKGALGKLKPWIMPATAGLTFYAAYSQRAKALNMSITDAIMYDVKNFDGQAAVQRLQDKAAPVLGATIGGYLVKKFAPGNLKLIGDALIGIGIGTAGKAILDPPVQGSSKGMVQRNIKVQQPPAGAPSPIPATNAASQYGTLGGY